MQFIIKKSYLLHKENINLNTPIGYLLYKKIITIDKNYSVLEKVIPLQYLN